MRLTSKAAWAAALFIFCMVATGCQSMGGHGCSDCAGPVGCDSFGGGCTSGNCGGLAGMIGGFMGGGCSGGACNDPMNCATPESLMADGYGVRGGMTGPLAGHMGQYHRGPQSHMGGAPGPADGPAIGQTTYPYYTTRGPRDFFASKPASIGP